jgi:hypothetical protein
MQHSLKEVYAPLKPMKIYLDKLLIDEKIVQSCLKIARQCIALCVGAKRVILDTRPHTIHTEASWIF